MYLLQVFALCVFLGLFNFSEPIGLGWQLVRHVPLGDYWHPAKDNLLGTEVYGTYVADLKATSAFSRRFQDTNFNEFLFATGDMSVWLRAPKASVYGTYTNEARVMTCSSGDQDYLGEARWTNRGSSSGEDPLIAVLGKDLPAVRSNLYYGQLLYAEGQSKSGNELLGQEKYGGANVFIRFKPGERASSVISFHILVVSLLFFMFSVRLPVLLAIGAVIIKMFLTLCPDVYLCTCLSVCQSVILFGHLC